MEGPKKEEAISYLMSLGFKRKEAARFLVANMAEAATIIKTVQERLNQEIALLNWQLGRGKWTILMPDHLAKWIWQRFYQEAKC